MLRSLNKLPKSRSKQLLPQSRLIEAQYKQFSIPTRGASTSVQSAPSETHESILQNINQYEKNILDKTQSGRALASQITYEVPENKFEKQQRYEEFINRMNQLYKNERRFQHRKKEAFARMEMSPLNSQSPLKLCLSEYNKLTVRGFDCSVLAGSLERLSTVVAAKGNRPKVYGDYSMAEMDQSWRMEKVADDLKHGLDKDNFFSPVNMAKISRHLGELGYKNTELIPLWFQKINFMLDNPGHYDASEPVNFERAVYGGQKNFVPRHYIFEGFLEDKEFKEHVSTILAWKQEEKASVNEDEELAAIEASMAQLISAANEVRDLQVDQQAAIETLRGQYFKLQEASDKHNFLKENKYIEYDLLELQELLVKGGYLDPEEALLGKNESDFDSRMERASQVFYDLVLTFNPEFISPQYSAFYKASQEVQNEPQQIDLKESHNNMDLSSLSGTLVGLSQQCLSFRRDARDRDYPNKFYEDFLMPEERRPNNPALPQELEMAQRFKVDHIMMERTYLNAWTQFSQHVDDLLPRLEKMIMANSSDIKGQLRTLRALSACRREARGLRSQIMTNVQRSKKKGIRSIDLQTAVDAAVGIAQCTFRPQGTEDFIRNYIVPTIARDVDQLSFTEAVDALHACVTGDFFSKGADRADKDLIKTLLTRIDSLSFERTDNELTFDQFNSLYDVYMTLKFDNQYGAKTQFQNANLVLALQNRESHIKRFPEATAGVYDPFKDRVVAGISESLAKTGVESVHLAQQADSLRSTNGEQYPFQPDLVMGVGGQKVGFFVLNNGSAMVDSGTIDGRTAHQLRVVEMAHKQAKNTIKSISVPISHIVDYDLAQFKLSLRNDFDLNNILESSELRPLNFNELSSFAAQLAGRSQQAMQSERLSGKFDAFLTQLFDLFQTKQIIDSLYEPEQVKAAHDELRFKLMTIQLMHDAYLSVAEKDLVSECLSHGLSFTDLITSTKNELPIATSPKKAKKAVKNLMDNSWFGTRQEVELPLGGEQVKSLVPELLNRDFLWTDDYHHYADWKSKMEATYDNFNMLQIPHNKDKPKYFFDQTQKKRRVPQGIFPLPNKKRVVLETPKTSTESPVNFNDSLVEFEKDSFKYMVKTELDKAKSLSDITDEVSMICNLQNVKQGLKSEYSDDALVQTVLMNLSLTDLLIQEHLSSKKTADKGTNFVERNPEAFREFHARQAPYQSPFNHYYLKEALKQGNSKQLFEKIHSLRQVGEKESEAQVAELTNQLETILINNYHENEDNFNLSKALDNYVEVTTDLKSLGVLNNKSLAREQDRNLTDEEFLQRERCRSEATLIKSKIIYKMNQDEELSANEKKYLSKWMKEASNSSNLINDDIMVPEKPSRISISSLTADDFYTLNSIPGVELDRKMHGSFALNDLAMEMSHFFDQKVVKNVELSCLEEKLKNDWSLQKDFTLVQSKNKEVDLVLQELEEVAWRSAGQFEDSEIESIKEMWNVRRGQDHFDRQFVQQDQQSFDEFMAQANSHDNRINLLEDWLARKEQEIKARVNMPTPSLQKPDSQLHAHLEKKFKPARERIVSSMLGQDEFGNDPVEKSYEQMTTSELHLLVEGLVVRLNLFASEYPSFLPQAVRAIMEHDNLSASDKSTMETYCKLFELDWRGDQNSQNQSQFLCHAPIYMNDKEATSLAAYRDYDANHIRDMLQNASRPYLSDLSSKLLQQASSK